MIEAWSVLGIYASTFAVIILGGLATDLKSNANTVALIKRKKQELLLCASRFNSQVKALEQSYKQDLRSLSSQPTIFTRLTNPSKESIRKNYEALYFKSRATLSLEVKRVLSEWDLAKTTSFNISKFWKVIIVAGLFTQVSACSYSIINEEIQEKASVQTDGGWTAKTIPMPHMNDGNRYVSNPDGVISPHTEALLDKQLKKMDDELGVESAVIIVNHIEDQDIFRFAQDVFDLYKVGKNNRGLVFVLAYKDRQVRTHTGSSLESDLTDVESFRLQEKYIIPCLKVDQPDSAMVYWTAAVYNLLQKKELPDFNSLEMPVKKAETSTSSVLFTVYFLLFIGWVVLYFFLSARHGWNLRSYAYHHVLPNPFVRQTSSVVIIPGTGGFGGGNIGGGFSGGGFSGGGFSGGGSGGGGATSSW
ncbi:MAG: TPM domain-containing protein [Prevotella sp.]|nr:TPM domain-containing protein [Prevotella sp.]